jgi:hypothetical protein
MERIIIRTAVIAGERLNDKPLDRAAADRLAKACAAARRRTRLWPASAAEHAHGLWPSRSHPTDAEIRR